MRVRHFVASLLALTILIACGAAAPTATPAATQTPQAAAPATKKPQAAAPGIYDPQANADVAITAALARAQTSGKHVLLDFGADWCPDCVVLDHLFKTAEVAPILETNFEVVHIDVGKWDNNLDIASRYDDPIKMGIPAVVIVDVSGKVLTSTRNGELANARSATPADIASFLTTWAPPAQ